MSKVNELSIEIWNFIVKTLPFSLAALSMSIAVQIKNKTATVTGVILSVVIGVSVAWLTGAYINKHFSSEFAPIIIGLVTISGEKIGYYLIYKLNVDMIMEDIIKSLANKFKK